MEQYNLNPGVEEVSAPTKKPVSKALAIIVWLLFWPVGLILIWKTAMSKAAKIVFTVITVACLALTLGVFAMGLGHPADQPTPNDGGSLIVSSSEVSGEDAEGEISIYESITVNDEIIKLN